MGYVRTPPVAPPKKVSKPSLLQRIRQQATAANPQSTAAHPVNALAKRPVGAARVVAPGGLGDDGLGVAPAVVVGALSKAPVVGALLNKLGPSHQAQNMASNKGIFDDLGRQAVQNPAARFVNFAGGTTGKTALAWLQQIVNGPGFQGGPGTPFPNNGRDFLVWGPTPQDAGRATELGWARDVLNAVQQTLAEQQPATPATASVMSAAVPTVAPVPAPSTPSRPADVSTSTGTTTTAPRASRKVTRAGAPGTPPETAPESSDTGSGGGIFDALFKAFAGNQGGGSAPSAPAGGVNVSVTAPAGGGDQSGGAAPSAPAGGGFMDTLMQYKTPLLIGGSAIGLLLLAPKLLGKR